MITSAESFEALIRWVCPSSFDQPGLDVAHRPQGPGVYLFLPSPTAATKAPESAVLTPIKDPDGHTLNIDNRTYNQLQRGLRCLGERRYAPPKGRWRILQHITTSPSRIGDITHAAPVLTRFGHGHLTENSVRSPQ